VLWFHQLEFEAENPSIFPTPVNTLGIFSTTRDNVGDMQMTAIIDSGATVNIIDRVAWEDLKRIKCETK
jgi:energy-converting hydrogenase Eha subunit A